jgi:hypothetical protein
MDTRQAILEALKASTSQNPMGFDELLKKTGLPACDLQKALDDMYSSLPAQVNWCHWTRASIAQCYYWPTASSFRSEAFVINPRKTVQYGNQPRPIRNTQTEQSTSPAAAQKGEVMEDKKKVSNVVLVKHVISNPGSTNAQLLELFAGSDPVERNRITVMISNCLTKNYLKRQDDKTLVVGDNELWLAEHDLLPVKEPTKTSVAAGYTESGGKPPAQEKQPEGVSTGSGGGVEGTKGMEHPEKTTAKPSLLELHNQLHHPEIVEMGASLLMPDEIESTLDEGASLPAFLVSTGEETKPLADLILDQSEQQVQTELEVKSSNELPKFRISVSSDRTLTIHGKTFMPVELDEVETQQLVDFIDHASRLLATY